MPPVEHAAHAGMRRRVYVPVERSRCGERHAVVLVFAVLQNPRQGHKLPAVEFQPRVMGQTDQELKLLAELMQTIGKVNMVHPVHPSKRDINLLAWHRMGVFAL